jgi:hypothetical protein
LKAQKAFMKWVKTEGVAYEDIDRLQKTLDDISQKQQQQLPVKTSQVIPDKLKRRLNRIIKRFMSSVYYMQMINQFHQEYSMAYNQFDFSYLDTLNIQRFLLDNVRGARINSLISKLRVEREAHLEESSDDSLVGGAGEDIANMETACSVNNQGQHQIKGQTLLKMKIHKAYGEGLILAVVTMCYLTQLSDQQNFPGDPIFNH